MSYSNTIQINTKERKKESAYHSLFSTINQTLAGFIQEVTVENHLPQATGNLNF